MEHTEILYRNVCDVPVTQTQCHFMSRHINIRSVSLHISMISVSDSTRGNVSHGTDLIKMHQELILKQYIWSKALFYLFFYVLQSD